MKNQTLNYYNQNAEQYIEQTKNVDMSELYDAFTNNLPFHLGIPQNILDVGCGSGRDSFYFCNKLAMNVTAIEGSPELNDRAQKTYVPSEINWLNIKFDEIKEQGWENQFTGIWACASLLHLPFKELPEIITTLLDALISDGVMYVSFKQGYDERLEGERFFCDMNEQRLLQVLQQINIGHTIEYTSWITQDQRPDREVGWFNALITKKMAS